jgi:hypothetical protein
MLNYAAMDLLNSFLQSLKVHHLKIVEMTTNEFTKLISKLTSQKSLRKSTVKRKEKKKSGVKVK